MDILNLFKLLSTETLRKMIVELQAQMGNITTEQQAVDVITTRNLVLLELNVRKERSAS